MDYYSPAVHIASPAPTWHCTAPFEPEKQAQNPLTYRTSFAATDNVIDFFVDAKGQDAPTAFLTEKPIATPPTTTLADESAGMASSPSETGSATLSTDVEALAKRRVQLMAANYASGKESAEITARLEILNSRLLEQAPRVTHAQVEALESANEQLMQIRTAREARAKRLGVAV